MKRDEQTCEMEKIYIVPKEVEQINYLGPSHRHKLNEIKIGLIEMRVK